MINDEAPERPGHSAGRGLVHGGRGDHDDLIGAIISFILSKLGVDPAVARSPLIASISDVTCLMVYLTVAAGFLGQS